MIAADKKITMATFKSFMRKNAGKILVKTTSHFDGMIDGCTYNHDAQFAPATEATYKHENNFGLAGVWCVFGGRDYFSRFETETLIGIEVSNCCGSFTVAVAK